MGLYSDYLDAQLSIDALNRERKTQLSKISAARGGDMLVYAADLSANGLPIHIEYSDLLAIKDQLDNLTGNHLNLILETPGGSGEVAEDIVRLIRAKYESVSVIVPGYAKSAGTIMAMAADEIIMGPLSALGPIDAQLMWQGKVFSAHALLEGFKRIKEEVEEKGTLSKAYIPMLQGISPGELQSAQNALDFAQELVTEWLYRYKFREWKRHGRVGGEVTDEEKRERAKRIAGDLCNHQRWLTHSKSIKITDLRELGVRITDFSEDRVMADAIERYYTLLQMTLDTNIYKLFETTTSQIYRYSAHSAPARPPKAIIDVTCDRCKSVWKVQANLGKDQPLETGCQPFPKDNSFQCPSCKSRIDLADLRRQLELETKQPVL